MSRFNRSLRLTAIAGLTVGVASIAVAGAALPAGALPAPAAPVPVAQPVAQPVGQSGPVSPGQTPACVVQGALFEPLVLGLVAVGNPSQLPSAAAGYWSGRQTGLLQGEFGSHDHGWLSRCGLTGPAH
jgi:hypothetical protein